MDFGAEGGVVQGAEDGYVSVAVDSAGSVGKSGDNVATKDATRIFDKCSHTLQTDGENRTVEKEAGQRATEDSEGVLGENRSCEKTIRDDNPAAGSYDGTDPNEGSSYPPTTDGTNFAADVSESGVNYSSSEYHTADGIDYPAVTNGEATSSLHSRGDDVTRIVASGPYSPRVPPAPTVADLPLPRRFVRFLPQQGEATYDDGDEWSPDAMV